MTVTRGLALVLVAGAASASAKGLPRSVVVSSITATAATKDSEAWRVLDDDYATGWCAAKPGETLAITFDRPTLVDELVVLPASPAKAGVVAASFSASIEVVADGRTLALATKPGALPGDATFKLGKKKVKSFAIRFASSTATDAVCVSEVRLMSANVMYTPIWDVPAKQIAAVPAAVMATWDAFARCSTKALAARVALPIEVTERSNASTAPTVTRYATAAELAEACRKKNGPKPTEPGEGSNSILDTNRYRYPARELVFAASLTIDTTMTWRFGWRDTRWQLVGIERRPTRN